VRLMCPVSQRISSLSILTTRWAVAPSLSYSALNEAKVATKSLCAAALAVATGQW